MRRTTSALTFPVLLLLGFSSACGQTDGAPAKELERHQGTWLAGSFTYDGKESAPEVVRSITRTVKDDHVVWKRNGKSFAGTKIELDATHDPKTIDVIPDGGPTMGKHILGIYKLEGDKLTICMAGTDKERPKSFEARKGSGQTLMVFERERPKK